MAHHAVVSSFDLDENYLAEIEMNSALHHHIVPMVSGMPGFVSGCWTRNTDFSSIDLIVVFETEEQTAPLVDLLTQIDASADGLKLRKLHTAIVLATA